MMYNQQKHESQAWIGISKSLFLTMMVISILTGASVSKPIPVRDTGGDVKESFDDSKLVSETTAAISDLILDKPKDLDDKNEPMAFDSVTVSQPAETILETLPGLLAVLSQWKETSFKCKYQTPSYERTTLPTMKKCVEIWDIKGEPPHSNEADAVMRDLHLIKNILTERYLSSRDEVTRSLALEDKTLGSMALNLFHSCQELKTFGLKKNYYKIYYNPEENPLELMVDGLQYLGLKENDEMISKLYENQIMPETALFEAIEKLQKNLPSFEQIDQFVTVFNLYYNTFYRYLHNSVFLGELESNAMEGSHSASETTSHASSNANLAESSLSGLNAIKKKLEEWTQFVKTNQLIDASELLSALNDCIKIMDKIDLSITDASLENESHKIALQTMDGFHDLLKAAFLLNGKYFTFFTNQLNPANPILPKEFFGNPIFIGFCIAYSHLLLQNNWLKLREKRLSMMDLQDFVYLNRPYIDLIKTYRTILKLLSVDQTATDGQNGILEDLKAKALTIVKEKLHGFLQSPMRPVDDFEMFLKENKELVQLIELEESRTNVHEVEDSWMESHVPELLDLRPMDIRVDLRGNLCISYDPSNKKFESRRLYTPSLH